MSQDIRKRIEDRSMPEPNSGCWLWLGSDNGVGYGMLSIAGRDRYAHRASYEVFKGAIPAGMVVRHKCDVPSCVNPDHLCVGTHADNVADRDQRGRTARGVKLGRAIKLTEGDVRAIRVDGRRQYDIADAYGINQSTISRIKNGHKWAHVS